MVTAFKDWKKRDEKEHFVTCIGFEIHISAPVSTFMGAPPHSLSQALSLAVLLTQGRGGPSGRKADHPELWSFEDSVQAPVWSRMKTVLLITVFPTDC